jgi:hypothetical protein
MDLYPANQVRGTIVKGGASRISTPFLIRRRTLNSSCAFKTPIVASNDENSGFPSSDPENSNF